jgi:hypothetical protein
MSYTEPGGITFSATEAVLLHHGFRDFWVRHRLRTNPRVSAGFDAILVRLVSFVDETKTCAPQPQSSPSAAEELIDTAEAAAILGCTPQWVGRIRGRLGVREIGSQRVFLRQTVVEYAERKAGQHK